MERSNTTLSIEPPAPEHGRLPRHESLRPQLQPPFPPESSFPRPKVSPSNAISTSHRSRSRSRPHSSSSSSSSEDSSNDTEIILTNVDIPAPFLIPQRSRRKYVLRNLEVDLLNKIHMHLWWAGRPGNIRPLHQQRVLSRDIVANEKPSMHLVWFDHTIYIKPLAGYLLNYDFWISHIVEDETLRPLALGFLHTYTKLIEYPSDFHIAQEHHLVPDGLTYSHWCELSAAMTDRLLPTCLNERYIYGELRLRRLNQIQRYWYGAQSYRSEYVTYSDFFRHNFAWLLLTVVYASVVLSALQVVLSTDMKTKAADSAGYWLAMVMLGVVALGLVVQVVLFVVLFWWHFAVTIANLNEKGVKSLVSKGRDRSEEEGVSNGGSWMRGRHKR